MMNVELRHIFIFFILLYMSFLPQSNAYFSEPFDEIFHSLKNTVSNFISGIFGRDFKRALSAALEEDCEFKCPNGRKPKPNPFYEPKANGCGVPGLQIPKYVPIKKFEDCCDDHDICYGTCNKSKDKCDAKFKKCFYEICSSLQKYVSEDIYMGCKIIAKTLYTAVTAMGCKFYLDAQEKACICDARYYDSHNEF